MQKNLYLFLSLAIIIPSPLVAQSTGTNCTKKIINNQEIIRCVSGTNTYTRPSAPPGSFTANPTVPVLSAPNPNPVPASPAPAPVNTYTGEGSSVDTAFGSAVAGLGQASLPASCYGVATINLDYSGGQTPASSYAGFYLAGLDTASVAFRPSFNNMKFSGSVSGARLPGNNNSKVFDNAISECPGSFVPPPGAGGRCKAYGIDGGGGLRFYSSATPPQFYENACGPLDPNKVYYFNLRYSDPSQPYVTTCDPAFGPCRTAIGFTWGS